VGATKLGAFQADLYAAEAASIEAWGMTWTRLAPARAYVGGLVSSEWFFERWPWFVRCAIERRGEGARWSTMSRLDDDGPGGRPTEGVILVAGREIAQPVLLHELAHLVAAPDVGHGPEFADILLALVRKEMGFFAYAELHQALARSDSFRGAIKGR
jgi:hypothetical protein